MEKAPKDTINTGPTGDGINPLDSIRAILLADVQEGLGALERQIDGLQRQTDTDKVSLQQQLEDILVELEQLRKKIQKDAEELIPRVAPELGNMIGGAIRDSRDEMAEALGPVMGEAIRVQIRNSRKDMIEALFPIIGETVQRAIGEFAKELQRNIDAQLRRSIGPQGFLRIVFARLRGIPASQLTLRDALPFAIREIFLIQHGSGLLLAHYHPSKDEAPDTDLISAMLTATRDFVHDSFGQGEAENELDEVQYGDQRIIIQSGRTAYLAVVITGVEPEGFRSRMHTLVSEMHVSHGIVFKRYNGDSTTIPNLRPKLAILADEYADVEEVAEPLSRGTKLALAIGSLLGIILVGLACFYLQFTIALFPLAFPSDTPIAMPTATSVSTLTATETSPPTFTATPIFTPTDTFTPAATFTPSFTPTPIMAVAAGNVWVRPEPDYSGDLRFTVLRRNTSVRVLSVYGLWMEVEWQAENGLQRGWVLAEWITLLEPVLADQITPTQIP